MTDGRPIVAGVDGSPSSLAAAGYAAGLAERAQVPLHLIHGFLRTPQTYDVTGPGADRDEHAREEVEFALRDLAKSLRSDHPLLTAVEARQVAATAVCALIDQSRTAAATVVGSRGIGGFTELMLGSVSSQLATYAHGPVVVVRTQIYREVAPLGPVLVGYDGSPGSAAALEFAAAEADLRGVPLVIANVCAEQTPVVTGDSARLVADAASTLLRPYPRLAIELRTIAAGNTGSALVEQSRRAGLVVVGSRRPRGLPWASARHGRVEPWSHRALNPFAINKAKNPR